MSLYRSTGFDRLILPVLVCDLQGAHQVAHDGGGGDWAQQWHRLAHQKSVPIQVSDAICGCHKSVLQYTTS